MNKMVESKNNSASVKVAKVVSLVLSRTSSFQIASER